jgi:hypothetical protein
MAECTWCSREIESPGLCERCTLSGFTREEWNARIDRLRWIYGVVWVALAIVPFVVWFAWGEVAAVVTVAGMGLLLVYVSLEGGLRYLFGPFFERKL